MSEGNKPFVVTDRRRFTVEGDVRPDAPPPSDRESSPAEAAPSSMAHTEPSAAPPERGPIVVPSSSAISADDLDDASAADFPAPTAEQAEQSRRAYQQTADRIDTAIRSANPGMEHPPAANFEQLVQSLYMTAIVQLGGATGQDQQPQIDLLGARSSIDLLAVLSEKTRGNLSDTEITFLESALFEVRMAFLEITQALARQASTRPGQPGSPAPGSPFGAGPAPGPVGVKR